MKRIVICIALLNILVASCGPKKSESVKEIQDLENTITPPMIFSPDHSVCSQLLSKYMQFAEAFPKDSLAPIYLYKAAELAQNIAIYDTCILCADRFIESYPDSKQLGDAYMLKGISLENTGKYEDAKATYQAFVEKCPDHPLVKDIKIQLDNNMIGMSPEEQLDVVTKSNIQDTTNFPEIK